MNEISISKVLKLPIEERIKLIGIIWDSIAEFPDVIQLTDKQKKELDKRIEDFEKNPGGNINWPDAKEKILNKNGL